MLKGYEVKISAEGMRGLQDWKEWHPDLIVLDIMLPGIDGLSVLRSIRLEDERVPILILSAKGDTIDRIKGFSYGVTIIWPNHLTWKSSVTDRAAAAAGVSPRH
jgi:DNA-binding response OmpR family regulator